MADTIKYFSNYLKVIGVFAFAFLLLFSSIFIIASYSGRLTASQKQEYVLTRHIKSNWQSFASNNDAVCATQPSVIRSGKKALKPMGQAVSKITVLFLNICPLTSVDSPEYFYTTSVFEITPCYQQFLQIGSLLI